MVKKGVGVVVPDYAGLMTFEARDGWIDFVYSKKAPLIHRVRVGDELLIKCLVNLSWRNYGHIADKQNLFKED